MEQNKRMKLDVLNLNQDHKDAAQEICDMLDEMGQSIIVPLIKERFRLIQRNRFVVDESKFAQIAKKHGVFFHAQGYVIEGDNEYPMILVSEDIRKLDSMIEDLTSNDN
jgi:hypothetical protein